MLQDVIAQEGAYLCCYAAMVLSRLLGDHPSFISIRDISNSHLFFWFVCEGGWFVLEKGGRDEGAGLSSA